ncbi:MAG: Rieske (2Fe-2S) protein [Deltaproteobacteria bacterium]|nr:Rieske (2Fe-2S) protein [Deltaproteobacteria bacterium]
MDDTDAPNPSGPRRTFVRAAVALGGAGAVASIAWPVGRYLQPVGDGVPEDLPPTDVCADSELAPGQMRSVRVGPIPVIVLRRHDSSLVAWSALCTHLGCTVRFRPESDDLHCACHGAVFDAATGTRRSGPAPSALAKLKIEVRHGRIVAWA